MKKMKNAFENWEVKAFEAEAKVGLIATVMPGGLPHITLISSIRAKDERTLVWGQFSEGFSKENVRRNPAAGFLIMTNDRRVWRGSARWTHEAREGPEYVLFNNLPMFRYNSYFGIHTVHYMDLVRSTEAVQLPLAGIIAALLLTKAAKGGAVRREKERVLKQWAQGLFNRIDSLKFISYVGKDGFPEIIPVIQCQAADSGRLVFAPTAFVDDLDRIPGGSKVAVFGLTLQMEDVLTRGTFNGFIRRRGIRLGEVDLDWVYNSMPPKQGQIYPAVEIKPVREF